MKENYKSQNYLYNGSPIGFHLDKGCRYGMINDKENKQIQMQKLNGETIDKKFDKIFDTKDHELTVIIDGDKTMQCTYINNNIWGCKEYNKID